MHTQIAELIQTMEKKAEELDAELRKTISELADCQTDRDSLQQTVTDLTIQIAILSAERQTIDSQLADLTSTNQQVISDRDQLRDELTALETERIELEARLNTVQISADLGAQLMQSEDEKEKLFLNLQEKIDEAKTSEAYEKQISDLTNAVSELTADKENLTEVQNDLLKQASHMRMELETMRSDLTSETKKLTEDLERARRANVSLIDENINLATEIEKVRTKYADSESSNRDKIESLKSELNRLETANSVNHQRIDELQKSVDAKSNDRSDKDKCAKLEADLQVTLADLETKIQECRQGRKIHAQLVHNSKILWAKLTQLRKVTADQEKVWLKERTELMEQRKKACTEIRIELEGKLSNMKERMKHMYNEETRRSKENQKKQERELIYYKHQCKLLKDKI